MIDSIPAGRALALVAAMALTPLAHAQTLMHLHGLSYSADGRKLMIPSHQGLAVYEDGKWSKQPGAQHDYMGFSATARHLYSSGHPAPGTGPANPFGLIRSRDGGKTWDKLGLEGETDFHLLATGWNSNAIYVWNAAPSSRLKRPGLHYTLNDGMVWKPASAAGLDGDPRALAVHPDEPAVVAVAGTKGIYVSSDSGGSFQRIAAAQGTGVFFDLDGKHLWYASFDGQVRLARAPVRGGPVMQINLPRLTDDAVAYVAQNPTNRDEYAIATFMRSVYLSKDVGRTWTMVADRGQGQ